MYILLSNLKGQIDPRPPMQASSRLTANGEGFFIQNIKFLASGFYFLQTITYDEGTFGNQWGAYVVCTYVISRGIWGGYVHTKVHFRNV